MHPAPRKIANLAESRARRRVHAKVGRRLGGVGIRRSLSPGGRRPYTSPSATGHGTAIVWPQPTFVNDTNGR